MKVQIIKSTIIKNRILDPGNEIDTDVMPLYSEQDANDLIASGHAQLSQQETTVQNLEPTSHDEREFG